MDQTEKELTKHLQTLTAAIQRTYGTTRALFWRSFLGGLFYGLGATLGVAIIIALLGFLVRELGGLPVIGDWFLDLGKFLPN